MRIVYEILLKIWEKLKTNNFLKRFWILKQNLLKIRDKLWTSINAEIRNFKNEKILNFSIDF